MEDGIQTCSEHMGFESIKRLYYNFMPRRQRPCFQTLKRTFSRSKEIEITYSQKYYG